MVLTAFALIALLASGMIGWGASRTWAHPGDRSAEAGFARDMQAHHAQAVEMALIIRDKTSDPTLRAISYDIITTQQQQAGQMYGWLTQWGLPQTGSHPAMTWMGTSGSQPMTDMMHGATPSAPTEAPSPGRMPGMASGEELAQFRAATGIAAERLFLTLMIKHHKGGVEMADAILSLSDRSEVVALASAIQKAQTVESEQLTTLLTERTDS
ncbi:DUF305 domain-containing protein [Knoellia aerolata]|uniref:DUF305 domain-containing protein n=1 Tax=Knoellia aerolata DSM 18566 TaxID=1385519 RepID=A0A0A0JZN3_9MICO|nr:DUF305 domain-containing protein [Knoellia aerolata]KGN40986.1 hypothetical protein N801_09900 [Knoellia aerolata DSM 18566]